MNHNKVTYYKYQSRLNDKAAIKRLEDTNKTQVTEYSKKNDNHTFKIIFSELDDESLLEIQKDLVQRISAYNIEAFELTIRIRKISRILKLRKTPKLTD